MPAQTSMLHVRVDDQLKAQATDALSGDNGGKISGWDQTYSAVEGKPPLF